MVHFYSSATTKRTPSSIEEEDKAAGSTDYRYKVCTSRRMKYAPSEPSDEVDSLPIVDSTPEVIAFLASMQDTNTATKNV